MGDGLRFDKVMDTTERVLVIRVRGRRYSVALLRKWVQENLGKNLIRLPEVRVLDRGWFALKFDNVE